MSVNKSLRFWDVRSILHGPSSRGTCCFEQICVAPWSVLSLHRPASIFYGTAVLVSGCWWCPNWRKEAEYFIFSNYFSYHPGLWDVLQIRDSQLIQQSLNFLSDYENVYSILINKSKSKTVAFNASVIAAVNNLSCFIIQGIGNVNELIGSCILGFGM